MLYGTEQFTCIFLASNKVYIDYFKTVLDAINQFAFTIFSIYIKSNLLSVLLYESTPHVNVTRQVNIKIFLATAIDTPIIISVK